MVFNSLRVKRGEAFARSLTSTKPESQLRLRGVPWHTFVHEKPGSDSSEGDLLKVKEPERHILLAYESSLLEPGVPPMAL